MLAGSLFFVKSNIVTKEIFFFFSPSKYYNLCFLFFLKNCYVQVSINKNIVSHKKISYNVPLDFRDESDFGELLIGSIGIAGDCCCCCLLFDFFSLAGEEEEALAGDRPEVAGLSQVQQMEHFPPPRGHSSASQISGQEMQQAQVRVVPFRVSSSLVLQPARLEREFSNLYVNSAVLVELDESFPIGVAW